MTDASTTNHAAPVPVSGLDHVAITCADPEVTIEWYRRVAGAELLYEELWRDGRLPIALLQLGSSRLSVHRASSPASPHAATPTVGSADLCFRSPASVGAILDAVAAAGVEIVEGPVPRPAADGGAGQSVYVRDPDGNLVEFLTTAG